MVLRLKQLLLPVLANITNFPSYFSQFYKRQNDTDSYKHCYIWYFWNKWLSKMSENWCRNRAWHLAFFSFFFFFLRGRKNTFPFIFISRSFAELNDRDAWPGFFIILFMLWWFFFFHYRRLVIQLRQSSHRTNCIKFIWVTGVPINDV